ncbi:SGNH/GDSL hydrolase family protein [Prosthecobacter sp.]|uniref:SGNH/GDSL hydrolase family protein n=1 Tax=Prosthecobacter sp. TaxID=1965333 RepID=UPI002ABADAB8|nr:SGNH/GDSL hydrolase family protein [Prosthecobacter sp.]MDZ4403432.1 SGNH/GDSL hydrolase family protein [Prosthecobacter sp.]
MNLRRFSLLIAAVLSSTGLSHAQVGKGERLLFIGNSITRHGPSAKVAWTGNWGMAASAEAKDYVHLVVDAVAKKRGVKPEFLVANVADLERSYATVDAAAKLTTEVAFKADTVIVAIGENVPGLKTAEAKTQFKEAMVKLLTLLKRDGQATLYVRSCFWADATKDAILKEACEATGGVFVDIGTLGKDEANYARSERKFEHEGVARHPGDKGMGAIADAIFVAMAKAWK